MSIPSFEASNSSVQTPSAEALKRNSDDIGWNYAILANPANLGKVICKLCKKAMSGGVYRIKLHIANIKGQVLGCPKSSDEDKAKCRATLDEAKTKKEEKKNHIKYVREDVSVTEEKDDDVAVGSKRKESVVLGAMDKYARAINPEFSLDQRKKKKQQNIIDALAKERTQDVHQYVARWVYEASIPFHAIDNESFLRVVEAIGIHGLGYQPPSQYELREPLLKKEVERTKASLKKQEEEWRLNGCSIMIDAWTDRKRRSIMNLCVNCKEGTTFLSSKEASSDAHTGQYIFEYVDACIEQIGSKM